MDIGPVKIWWSGSPAASSRGRSRPAFAELVESGLIRVIDLVFVTKGDDGDVVGIELSTSTRRSSAAFHPHVEEPSGLLADEDIEDLGADLAPGSVGRDPALRARLGHEVP